MLFRSLGDPTETYLNKALTIIGPTAFKPNTTSGAASLSRANKLANSSLSDNSIQDKFDMFDKPLKQKK